MRVSTFAHKRSTEPVHADLATLSELYAALEGFEVAEKEDAPLWSPAEYRLGGTRRIDDVRLVHALVLDVDHSTPEAFAAWYRAQSTERFWYLTFQGYSSVEARVRIVFARSRPVMRDEWPRSFLRRRALGAPPRIRPAPARATACYAPSQPVSTEEGAVRLRDRSTSRRSWAQPRGGTK
jgi:hypothetical protein